MPHVGSRPDDLRLERGAIFCWGSPAEIFLPLLASAKAASLARCRAWRVWSAALPRGLYASAAPPAPSRRERKSHYTSALRLSIIARFTRYSSKLPAPSSLGSRSSVFHPRLEAQTSHVGYPVLLYSILYLFFLGMTLNQEPKASSGFGTR